MCDEVSPGSTDGADAARPFARGRLERRTFLTAGTAGLLFSSVLGALPAEAARSRKRAYVLVVDGCRPEEIDAGLTPNLLRLRSHGYRFPRASSMPIMETIPNHVMMMTGMRPDRTGVPANVVYDRSIGATRTLDRPSDIRTGTILGRLNRSGFTTGTVLSKEYLYGVFGARATHRWEPQPVVPVSGHAPDAATMDAALTMLDEFDPNLMFVNLGDIDRMGHADFTGTSVRLAREAALADTDAQVQRFVTRLKETGRWRNSIVIVLADHSMDWSRPDRVVALEGALAADPFLAGRVQIADNGGAELLYWTGSRDQKRKAIARMRAIAQEQPGVLATHERTQDWLRLGPQAGDVVVFCKAGWRFSEGATSNPIPGNHGHPATRPIPFFISGGHPVVPRRRASSAHARTVDVAPTLAQFFGLRAPRGGWDGHGRLPS